MTECGTNKMRSLIKEHLGEEQLKKYDDTIDACNLGNALKDERTWAPLCPAYPNLKGVTCEEIDEFIKYRLPEFFYSDEYISHAEDIMERYKKAYDAEPKDEFGGIADPNFFYSGAGGQIKHDFVDLVFYNIPEDMKEKVINDISGYSLSVQQDIINNKYKQRYDFGRGYSRITPMELAEEYLHHVKVYDRDEEYSAFKKIGDQIEADSPGMLHSSSTIFVTTPRGGHEMLSIFTYANNIGKKQIPSDIKFQHITDGAPISEENYRENPMDATKYLQKLGYKSGEGIPTDVYGMNWLRDKSSHIKNIFIIDDIIASGEQIHKTAMKLEEMFPDATINSVTLCKRKETFPALPTEINKYYTNTPTNGIHRFEEMREKGEIDNEYVTCLFPHACPDGISDNLMVELMGDERCSPEKRIARKDL